MPRHKSQTESLLYDKSCKYFRAYSWLSWTGLNLMNNWLPTVTLRLYQRHESQAESLVYQHKSFKYFRAYSWLSWTGLNYDEQHASTYVCKIHWDLSLTLTDSGTNQFKSMEQQSGSILSWMLNKWWWTTGQRQFSKDPWVLQSQHEWVARVFCSWLYKKTTNFQILTSACFAHKIKLKNSVYRDF